MKPKIETQKRVESFFFISLFKVRIFYEGHKNLRNLQRPFDSVKLTVKMSSIFVAFLENMNFNFESPIFALCAELAKLGKASQNAHNPGGWLIL